jgi:phenylalanine-4-hydroxylase
MRTQDLQDTHDTRVHLDASHPGFGDPAYRQRRDQIAAIARAYDGCGEVPDAPYVPEEHATWASILSALAPLHARHVAREVLDMQHALPLPTARIPSFAEVNAALASASGLTLRPVTGLVPPRRFFTALDDGTFLATQYVRHASRPWYTPEPDVIHELVGHAATLAHPALARLNRAFGAAARVADAATMAEIERVYWFTLEFGLVEQGRGVVAVGAGLLSSRDELVHGIADTPKLPWDLDRIAATSYDTDALQPVLFVAPSFAVMIHDVEVWLAERVARMAGPATSRALPPVKLDAPRVRG